MQNFQENRQRSSTIEQPDPYGVSYPQSAGKYLFYRIGVAVFAILMIVIGKSNLPDDSVTCIQDSVIDFLQPITNFYNQNLSLGLIFTTLMQLLVDVELIGMAFFWYFKGNSFRYPLLLAVLGVSKILLNILFEVRPIQEAFTEMVIPSLCFGQNFKNTYFFSGITAFLLFNLLQLRKMKYYGLMKVQILVLIYCILMLLSMRLNFFMDIITALIFGHIVFLFVSERIQKIDSWISSFLDVKQDK